MRSAAVAAAGGRDAMGVGLGSRASGETELAAAAAEMDGDAMGAGNLVRERGVWVEPSLGGNGWGILGEIESNGVRRGNGTAWHARIRCAESKAETTQATGGWGLGTQAILSILLPFLGHIY